MDSTSKAQLVLPAVFKAIEDITKLSDTYENYTNDLRITGLEIQQIELLNRGLETQTRNLEILNEEVQKIIVFYLVPYSHFNIFVVSRGLTRWSLGEFTIFTAGCSKFHFQNRTSSPVPLQPPKCQIRRRNPGYQGHFRSTPLLQRTTRFVCAEISSILCFPIR